MRDILALQAVYDLAAFYERREEDRWAIADICALLSDTAGDLQQLATVLPDHFGISINLQTLKNYARVAKSFEEEHRHYQYKWSNFLEWSKHEDPVKAMEFALDNGYSPTQMARLRRYGDPEYKKPKPLLCQVCNGELGHCRHDDWEHLGTVEFPDGEKAEIDYQEGRVAKAIIYPGPLYEKLLQEDSITVSVNPDVGFSGKPEPIDPGELKVLRMAHGYDKGQAGGVELRDSELESTAEDRQEAAGAAQEVRE